MHHSKNQTVSRGIQPRLAAPGGRTRATSTCMTTVRHQITPGYSPEFHPTFGTVHCAH